MLRLLQTLRGSEVVKSCAPVKIMNGVEASYSFLVCFKLSYNIILYNHII